ncbi:unnamed protein product [Triticum turgidum subsp. durum]|uniref:GH18 domain-containing protein n=1 Tax=Triticum turgidum subsp. durum TaxID=4567 RepID=A0A9R0V4Y3_TRITD|nr:unnamed protein product [Triticum turgidum subsp. durum]
MGSTKLIAATLLPAFLALHLHAPAAMATAAGSSNSNLFRDYIGALYNGVRFADVPVDPRARDTVLTPDAVAEVKRRNPKVRVAVSLGGATVNGRPVFFNVTSGVDSWVRNAVDSLTGIIRRYGLDGIDIDYEQFQVDPATFAECAGRLVAALKSNGVISFASIAPYGNADVQRYYRTLWAAHGAAIDYVNFQFYAYGASTTAAQYVSLFDEQIANYPGANILASFTTAATNTSVPVDTALSACRTLQGQGKLYGIFVWAADHSRNQGFKYETQSQALLTDATTY